MYITRFCKPNNWASSLFHFLLLQLFRPHTAADFLSRALPLLETFSNWRLYHASGCWSLRASHCCLSLWCVAHTQDFVIIMNASFGSVVYPWPSSCEMRTRKGVWVVFTINRSKYAISSACFEFCIKCACGPPFTSWEWLCAGNVPETRHDVGLSSLKEDIHRLHVGQVKWYWLQSLNAYKCVVLEYPVCYSKHCISDIDNDRTALNHWGAALHLRHLSALRDESIVLVFVPIFNFFLRRFHLYVGLLSLSFYNWKRMA